MDNWNPSSSLIKAYNHGQTSIYGSLVRDLNSGMQIEDTYIPVSKNGHYQTWVDFTSGNSGY